MFKIRRYFAILLVSFLCLSISGTSRASDLNDLRQWMVSRMSSWAPPGRTYIPEAKETPEEGQKRYAEIADAALAVTFDPSESSMFPGKYGRLRTSALILSIALSESAYRKDVDLNLGKEARGDGGRSWCMVQVQLGAPVDGKTPKRIILTKDGFAFSSDKDVGYGGEDLVADRQVCFRVGLHLMRRSFLACRSLPLLERLSAYTSGNCEDGHESSKTRVERAIRWMTDHPPPLDDLAVKTLLFPDPPQSPQARVLTVNAKFVTN